MQLYTQLYKAQYSYAQLCTAENVCIECKLQNRVANYYNILLKYDTNNTIPQRKIFTRKNFQNAFCIWMFHISLSISMLCQKNVNRKIVAKYFL